jgi:hypothetical protein
MGLETAYLTELFTVSLSYSKQIPEYNRTDHFLSQHFNKLFTDCSIICCYIICATESFTFGFIILELY